MKFKCNEEGKCPICGSQMIEYFGMELEDTAVYYPWHCPECDTDGKEWYNVNFSEVRSNDDHIGNEAGICPDCGSEIEYGTAEPDGNSLRYEYFCPECENSGTEWYDLDFDSHTIDGHEDENIVRESKKIKTEATSYTDLVRAGEDLWRDGAVVKETNVEGIYDCYTNGHGGYLVDTDVHPELAKYGEKTYVDNIVGFEEDYEALKVIWAYPEVLSGKVQLNNDWYDKLTLDDVLKYEDSLNADFRKEFPDKKPIPALSELGEKKTESRYKLDVIKYNMLKDKYKDVDKFSDDLSDTEKEELNTYRELTKKLYNSTKDHKDIKAKEMQDILGNKKTEAIDYKNDKYTATTAEDNNEERAYYGKNMTKRDKVRSLDQAKRNLNRIGKDPRVTQGQAVDQVSFDDKALDTDLSRYKTNKEWAKKSAEKSDEFWADEHNKTAKQFADKIRAKHKKQEAVSKDVDIIWTNGFTFDKLKDDIKNNFDDIKETIDICDVEDREQGTSVYLAKYEGNLYLTLSKHNKDDYDDDFENTATVYVNKDKIANSNEAEFKKYILYLYNYLLGIAKPIKLGESSEDIEANEEENDIDFDDTISLLDMALSEIPTAGVEDWGKDDELLFTADTKVLFENLKSYEHKIPRYYYDNASNDDWSNGIDDYLDEIKDVNLNNGESDNTYNWNAPLTHDVEFTIYEADDGCYFKGSIHRAGDVRGNYTTEFLLKFNDKDDCLEALFDSCAGFCQREVKLENTTYVITPHFFNECVDIYNLDTDEAYDDVYCCCIDELKEIIAENKDSEE